MAAATIGLTGLGVSSPQWAMRGDTVFVRSSKREIAVIDVVEFPTLGHLVDDQREALAKICPVQS